ncbi:MAG: type II toxin-antitoxin system Phd/YefM family antitoxin [Stackebrandtia sp.]
MRTISAAQASREFHSLLDRVASGETIVITRDGRPVACMTPERAASGAELLALFAKRPSDPDFADDLEAVHAYRTSLPDRAEGLEW